jgi:hypothetical protein
MLKPVIITTIAYTVAVYMISIVTGITPIIITTIDSCIDSVFDMIAMLSSITLRECVKAIINIRCIVCSNDDIYLLTGACLSYL